MFVYRDRIVTVIKLLALLLMLVAAPMAWLSSLSDQVSEALVAGKHLRLVKLVSLFGCCLVAMCLGAFVSSNKFRALFAFGLGLGIAVDQIALSIFGQHFSLELSMLAWIDRANAFVTLPEYSQILLRSAVFGGLLMAVVVIRPPARLTRDWFTIPFIFLVLFATAFVQWASKFKHYNLPAPMAWPSIVGFTLVQSQREDKRARKEISDPGAANALRRFRHVVFIVDESVRGDRLTINNRKWDTTPFLADRGAELVNFGEAISGTNCSVTSRMLMRFGGRTEELPDRSNRLMEKPTVWQYAQQAGFKTFHLDPFRLVGSFHSGMSAIEARGIHEMISVATLPMPQQDPALAKILTDLLGRAEPSFILLNKNGVHPVFSKQYPPEMEYDPQGLDALPLVDEQREVIRHYHRALRWSVDGFFKDVWPALLAPDVLTIYTSDHGLALFEGGFAATHCSVKQPAAGEGIVPLFVVSGDPSVAQMFKRGTSEAAHAATHFNVFPTLLWALGYNKPWIVRTYGTPLNDPDRPRHRKFWTGALNAGGKESWADVDELRAAQPLMAR